MPVRDAGTKLDAAVMTALRRNMKVFVGAGPRLNLAGADGALNLKGDCGESRSCASLQRLQQGTHFGELGTSRPVSWRQKR